MLITFREFERAAGARNRTAAVQLQLATYCRSVIVL